MVCFLFNSHVFIELFFLFSLKRKENSKNKKDANGKKEDDSDESNSSSSDEEKDIPVSNTEITQPIKEPTPPPPPPQPTIKQQQQQHEKGDIRKNIRNRKADSSDEEEKPEPST